MVIFKVFDMEFPSIFLYPILKTNVKQKNKNMFKNS